MPTLSVIPAYGRDYSSAAAVKADWDAGKDFRVYDLSSHWDGSYLNKAAELPEGTKVMVRYNKHTRVTRV